jgi:hypothetical protein
MTARNKSVLGVFRFSPADVCKANVCKANVFEDRMCEGLDV